MSEFSAKTIRAARKAKASRMGSADPHTKVDSSDWTPAEPLNADVKTGARPISRRAFKSGGKVCGEKAKANMGRKPRKAGGVAAKDYANAKVNRNVKDANEEREGIKHVGGFKKGGRTKREYGGRGIGERTQHEMKRRDAVEAASDYGLDPRVTESKLRDKTRAFEKSAEQTAYKKGGRAKKMFGGMMDPRENMVDPKALYGAKFAGAQGTPYKKGGKVHSDEAMDRALIKKMVKPSARTRNATGGMIEDSKKALMTKSDPHNQSKIKPAQPTPKEDAEAKRHGGRAHRKSGGRTKAKGKTNINIVIAAGPKGQMQDPMMAGPPPSPATPPGMMMPPSGGAPMAAPPMGGAPMGMPPMGGAPAPMPRASGGRAGYAIGGKPVTTTTTARRVAPSPGLGTTTTMPRPGLGTTTTTTPRPGVMPPGPAMPQMPAPVGGPLMTPRPPVQQPVRDPGFGAPQYDRGPRQPFPGMQPPQTVMPGTPGMGPQFPVRDPGFGTPGYDLGPRQIIPGMQLPEVVQPGAPVQGMPIRDPGLGGPIMQPGFDQPISGLGRLPVGTTTNPPQPVFGGPQGGQMVQPGFGGFGSVPPQSTTTQQYLQSIGAVGRKSGGRVTKVAKSYKDMEAGAASGEGRLQKTDIAKRIPKKKEDGVIETDKRGYPNKVIGATGGRTAHKAGGKVYRSYKDMDAGAGSGKGRLEKEEIQKRKR